mgnify:CR=1 FL=1
MADRILLIIKSSFEAKVITNSLTFNGFAVTTESSDMTRAMQLATTSKFDALVIELTDRKSLDFANNVRRIANGLGIVFIAPIYDLRLFGISIEEFPIGSQIIYKPDISNFELLIDAIRDSKEIGVKTQWVNPPKTNTTDELTDIQVETLRMIVEGFTNKEIGKHEFVSEKAIEQRIGRLASVLGITCSNGQNLRVKLATKYVNWTNGRI